MCSCLAGWYTSSANRRPFPLWIGAELCADHSASALCGPMGGSRIQTEAACVDGYGKGSAGAVHPDPLSVGKAEGSVSSGGDISDFCIGSIRKPGFFLHVAAAP